MLWADLEKRLKRGLARPLPGVDAQLRLSPRPRLGWTPGQFPRGCRDGAGLLLLYPIDGAAHLLLTVRAAHLPKHAGQVSLPGGAVEPGETIAEAALREANEEVGVDPGDVRVAGELSALHVPVSGFVLHPVVGLLDRRPKLRADPSEVARILEVPLERLADPASAGVDRKPYRGREYEVPFVDVQGEKLWGATAMIVSELLALLGYA